MLPLGSTLTSQFRPQGYNRTIECSNIWICLSESNFFPICRSKWDISVYSKRPIALFFLRIRLLHPKASYHFCVIHDILHRRRVVCLKGTPMFCALSNDKAQNAEMKTDRHSGAQIEQQKQADPSLRDTEDFHTWVDHKA